MVVHFGKNFRQAHHRHRETAGFRIGLAQTQIAQGESRGCVVAGPVNANVAQETCRNVVFAGQIRRENAGHCQRP